MKQSYQFKRTFYYDVEKAIKGNSVTFISGPKGCGKTVCLKQLYESFSASSDFEKVLYIDAKREPIPSLGKKKFIDDIIDAVNENSKTLFLIDEATYIHNPDWSIIDIQYAFESFENTNTKIVFTGNPSKALSSWGHQAFANDAAYIHADFLSYREWLNYMNIPEPSEENYPEFLKGTKEFYKNFGNIKNYLADCLNETIYSNEHSINIIDGNDCSNVTVDKLLNVLYSSFARSEYFINAQNIRGFIDEKYKNLKSMTALELKQCLQFLNNCGSITNTYITDDLNADETIYQKILSPFNDNFDKNTVIERMNIRTKYPMLYIDLIRNISEETFDNIPSALLNEIVKCHVRSLLPNNGCIEYTDKNRKIDYVCTSRETAIKISVSDEESCAADLDFLPDRYEKIVISKNIYETKGNIKYIPYYQFIFDNSN